MMRRIGCKILLYSSYYNLPTRTRTQGNDFDHSVSETNVLLFFRESTQSTVTIDEAIKQHRAKVLDPNNTNALCITVRRGSILDDTIFSLRPGFDEKKHIKVRFLGKFVMYMNKCL